MVRDLNDKVGSDQLRQRMAYALSELLVVSKQFSLNGRSEGLLTIVIYWLKMPLGTMNLITACS